MYPAIETPRLALIPMTADHVEAFHSIWSDPQATQWSLRGPCADLAASAAWMSGCLRDPSHDDRRSWLIYVTPNITPDQCIGILTWLPWTGSDVTDAQGKNMSAWEIGYLFRPEWWGKGYATEAGRAGIESLKRDMDGVPAVLIAQTDLANGGSRAVCRKLGFEVREKREGSGIKSGLGGEVRVDDTLYMEMRL